MDTSINSQLWPEDKETDISSNACVSTEPDYSLALVLLTAGCTPAVIKDRCGFRSARDVRAFAGSPEVKEQMRGLQRERIDRVGNRAMVRLESLLARDDILDIKALTVAIRAGLDLAGLLKPAATVPVRRVQELSVGELNELIASTESELKARITRSVVGDSSASRDIADVSRT
jgi:hypothetical protein